MEKVKKFLKSFFLIDDSPQKIAAGAALGVFLGIIPGAGIAATLVFSSLLKVNRLAAMVMVVAVNTWITVIIMPLSAALGGFIFQINPQVLADNFRSNYDLGWKTFFEESVFFSLLLPLIVGFIIVAGIISLSTYSFLYYLLKNKKIKLK